MEDEENLSASEQRKADKQRADANNAQTIRNAADVAIATGEPHAAAVGATIKGIDAATGGKGSEIVGKALTKVNQATPMGHARQDALNKLNESGAGDKIGKAASLAGSGGAGEAADAASKGVEAASKGADAASKGAEAAAKGAEAAGKELPNQVKNKNVQGGESKESLPSSDEQKQKNAQQPSGQEKKDDSEKEKKSRETSTERTEEEEEELEQKTFLVRFIEKHPVIAMAIGTSPVFLIMVLVVLVVAIIIGSTADFDDAFGIQFAEGDSVSGMVYNASSPEQAEFFQRILDVRSAYQEEGKNVDPLKIVAVYVTMKRYNAGLSYESMTTEVIEDIADCMFLDTTYSDETFKNNLVTYFIPKYLPNTTDGQRVSIANQVFDYISQYHTLVGKEKSSTCSSMGTCNYTIDGFYIQGKGNVTKNIQVNDLYVRLMQCGRGNGHDYGGTFGQPLAGEELVPFEKYILGVAYAEIGPSAPPEAFKAQMVAARGYILARPTDMGGWRTLKEENGRWILQVAACTQDQVYCDPDQGCSSTNGQWAMVHSGQGHGTGMVKPPLPQESPLRQYAAATQGEVVVNSNGYIVSTSYVSTESNRFMTLARSGLNYKQILLQVYNQSPRNYGATGIYKAACGNCVSGGSYASWRQDQGEWTRVPVGTSGRTIRDIGCLATSMAIQIARSGVPTNITGEFNPGTFVEYLNEHNGFAGGDLNWSGPTAAAPTFVLQNDESLVGMSRQEKLNRIRDIVSQPGVYAVCEVKGDTGQHWVAIDSVDGDTINMMDPGSDQTNMWNSGLYYWQNTSRIVYYRVS